MHRDLVAVPVPASETTVVGGVVRREYRIPAGMWLKAHTHDYDHLSVLLSGQALLSRDGAVKEVDGPCIVEIKAGIPHELYAVTDCVWDCIHALAFAQDAAVRGDPVGLMGVV